MAHTSGVTVDTAFYDILVNAGPLGVFAIYLIYKNSLLDKKLDKIFSDFQSREDALRDRYDKVISESQARSDEMRHTVSSKINGLFARTTDLQSKLDGLVTGIDRLHDTVKELHLEKLARQAVRDA